jgi:hypothetical protein
LNYRQFYGQQVFFAAKLVVEEELLEQWDGDHLSVV